MAEQTVVQLVEELEWRVETVRYLNLYAGCEEGEPSAEGIRDCIGRMILEIGDILEQTEGEDRRGPGDEGPLGPLPPEILDGGKEG